MSTPNDSLKSRLQKSMIDAMKAKDAARLSTLRMMIASVKKKEIDSHQELGDPDVVKLLSTMLKQLHESLDQARTAQRPETVQSLEAEIGFVKEFLPQELSSSELDAIVAKVVGDLKSQGALPTGPSQMGQVMKAVMAVVAGRADGKRVQAAVKAVIP
jgi:uncharacterized protein YqeY